MGDLGYKNINVKISSLGDIEMKYISAGDVRSYHFLNEELNDKIFTLKILHHQVIKPEVSFEDFTKKITDKDIEKLIAAYLELDSSIFGGGPPKNDLVKEFAAGIRKYLAEDLARTERALKPFKDSAEASLKHLNDTMQRISKSFPSIPSMDRKSILSESIKITSPEEYAWKRHAQTMDVLEKTVSIQEEILNEQKSSSSVARAALFVGRFTLAVAAATLVISLLLTR